MKKILMVAVEAKPYATAGGTSDVVGALAGTLREKGYDVRLVLPYYSAIIRAPRYRIEHMADLDVPVGSEPAQASIFRDNQSTYLVGGDPFGYLAKAGQGDVPVYPTLEDRTVDAGELYAFFCRATLELTKRFYEDGWQPDVIHCHDWPTGLLPALLKHAPPDAGYLKGIHVAFTVHNMSDVVYQGGWFGPELLGYVGLPKRLFHDGQVRHKGHVNLIKAGIVFSDRVNTVSEGYAREISSGKVESFITLDGTRKRFKCSGGLDGVWAKYGVNPIGIRNGIDDSYDPARIGEGEDWQFVDEDWKLNYAPASGQTIAGWAYNMGDPHLQRKKHDLKCYLQERCNRILNTSLEVSADIPVIAVRSRLTEQKGFDLILEGLQQWSHVWPVQFIIVAWGEQRYARQLKKLAAAHPEWIAFSDSWKVAPESLHYAGADMLLMPSLFEPCGLPHMMALRYGTIPIVRQTGGLADVVQDFDPASQTGNGFDFRPPNYKKMLQAVERALKIYHQHPDHWQALLTTAMQARDRHGHDFTWTTAAHHYLTELYDMGDQSVGRKDERFRF
ncbi:MAG: glycogen synthase [Chloroflexi bacterium]|nr:glycogen synthase [Chloroflexota bacterium]